MRNGTGTQKTEILVPALPETSYVTMGKSFDLSGFDSSVAKSYLTLLQHRGLKPGRLHCLFFPGKNTGVGCHSLLQGIFLTQGLNSRLLYWQVGSLPLSY